MRPGAHGLTLRSKVWKPVARRWQSSICNVAEEGQVVLLVQPTRNKADAATILTRPLRRNGRYESHRGTILHNDIIGKQFGDHVETANQKHHFRIQNPTLSEYTKFTPRRVTPIYPSTANLIVSLLDIHLDPHDSPSDSQQPAINILEAGTGHGSLTLHLARAIHGLNSGDTTLYQGEPEMEGRQRSSATPEAPRPERRAILHTLDIDQQNSEHAQAFVRQFRRGLYASNVQFHIGGLLDFLSESNQIQPGTISQRFTHVCLDLPSSHTCLSPVVDAMRDEGLVLIFCPQITQIADCVEQIQTKSLPLVCEQILEVVSNHSGGRPWTVEMKQTRQSQRKEAARQLGNEDHLRDGVFRRIMNVIASSLGYVYQNSTLRSDEGRKHVWVCKPSVGTAVTTGAFIGVWRRTNLTC